MNAEWHVLGRGERGRYVVDRGNTGYVCIVQVQYGELCTTEPGRIRQHGLEHRLQLAGRAADDLQHLRGRRLLLQRFRELARARLHLIEQPHVLDRDHRLVGEGFKQFDLLLTECPRLRAYYGERADDHSLAEKRHADSSSDAGSAW